MKILGLTRNQFLWVVFTLVVIAGATALNLAASKRRSRDAQRKADLRSVTAGLYLFRENYDSFPLSADGQILACGKPEIKDGQYFFNKCAWGVDGLYDVKKLPTEPHQVQGASYFYNSTGEEFALYASLEDVSDVDYNPEIVNLGLWCGNRVCNYSIVK